MEEVMRERVLKAAADWVWVPPDAEDIVTADYRVVVYAGRGPSVQWSSTTRPLDEVIGELRAKTPDGTALRWWVDARTQPETTGEILLSKGFREVEVLEILA